MPVAAAFPTPVTPLLDHEGFLTTFTCRSLHPCPGVPAHKCSGKLGPMAFCLLLLLCLSPYAPASLALGSAGARDAEQGAAPVTVFEQTLLFPQPMALFLQWMEARLLQPQRGQGHAAGCKMGSFAGTGPRAAHIPSLPFSLHQSKRLAFQLGIWPSPSAPCSRSRMLKFVCIRVTLKAH